MLSQSVRQVTYVLLTRPPLTIRSASTPSDPLDLHVLGTPPAFVLSQDQTLHKGCLTCSITLLLISINPLGLTGQFRSLFSFQRTIYFSSEPLMSRPELEYTMTQSNWS